MPIYEYHCKACNSTFEELVFGDETPSCPKCKSMDTEKLISRCSCHFGGGMGSFITMGLLLVVMIAMFFFTSRSNKKQEKEAQNMRDSLQVGDEITTIGGIIGKVVSIKEETLVLETSHDRTRIRILKTAVSRVDVKAEDAQD